MFVVSISGFNVQPSSIGWYLRKWRMLASRFRPRHSWSAVGCESLQIWLCVATSSCKPWASPLKDEPLKIADKLLAASCETIKGTRIQLGNVLSGTFNFKEARCQPTHNVGVPTWSPPSSNLLIHEQTTVQCYSMNLFQHNNSPLQIDSGSAILIED